MIEADKMGCHIITAPADVLKKLPALGTKTDAELSLDAVKAFREDALSVGPDARPSRAGCGPRNRLIRPADWQKRLLVEAGACRLLCNALNENVFTLMEPGPVAIRPVGMLGG